MIVIGGEILGTKKYILDPIRQTVQKKYSKVVNRETQFVGSSLLQYSVALGAVTIILKKIFQDHSIDNFRKKT